MAKKKIKKLLKGLGVGAALLGAGKALMNRRDKANQMKEFLATEGGDLSDMMPTGPFITRKRRDSILADPGINRITDYLPMKKGGKALKPVKPNQKGLKKLPKKVRNKMGYMKNGGRAK